MVTLDSKLGAAYFITFNGICNNFFDLDPLERNHSSRKRLPICTNVYMDENHVQFVQMCTWMDDFSKHVGSSGISFVGGFDALLKLSFAVIFKLSRDCHSL